MRIKKKHVLIESNLIDSLDEFAPQEKRLLFVLNKEYGPHNIHNFDIWKSAAFLIELFEIPYDLAYEMSKTYFYNGDKLFGEASSLRKKVNPSEIFFRHLSDITKNLKKHLLSKSNNDGIEEVGEVSIKFEQDDFGEWETEVENRNIIMWENSYGFTLYIPLRTNSFGQWPNTNYINTEDTDSRLIMASVKISPINIPIESKYGWDGDPDKVKVTVELRVGSDDNINGYKIIDWMSYELPLPKPLSMKKTLKTLTDIYDNVLTKIKTSNFILPDGVSPIIMSNG